MATLLWFVIACLVGLAAIFLLQDRLLYMPAKAGVERMASGGLRAWPSAQDFRGLVAEPAGRYAARSSPFTATQRMRATASSMQPH